MQFKTFVIPVNQSHEAEEELNHFLRSKRVLSVERHFAAEGGGRWLLLVEYIDGEQHETARPASRSREREDLTTGLTDEQRQRFEHFKQVRLEIAKRENVRAYMVFTDRELVTMAELDVLSLETIAKIKGVGEKRATQYGLFFMAEPAPLIEDVAHEKSGTANGSHMPY